MLTGWFLQLFVGVLTWLQPFTDPHYFDFHFSQNSNVLGFMSYMMQMNHFFPLDTWFVIGGLYGSLYIFFGAAKVAEVVLNIVRGAGLKL